MGLHVFGLVFNDERASWTAQVGPAVNGKLYAEQQDLKHSLPARSEDMMAWEMKFV